MAIVRVYYMWSIIKCKFWLCNVLCSLERDQACAVCSLKAHIEEHGVDCAYGYFFDWQVVLYKFFLKPHERVRGFKFHNLYDFYILKCSAVAGLSYICIWFSYIQQPYKRFSLNSWLLMKIFFNKGTLCDV